jgi:hypothetical protein
VTYSDELERHDLGHGATYSRVVNAAGEWVGIYEWHVCQDPDGEPSAGGVWFDVPGLPEHAAAGPTWTVESWDPLTLSPSIACRSCGHHGFIRDGKWVPA